MEEIGEDKIILIIIPPGTTVHVRSERFVMVI
jgi:hypothetical protein